MFEMEKEWRNVLYINADRVKVNLARLVKEEEKSMVADYAYVVGKELYKREVLSFEFSEQVKMMARVVICEIELGIIRHLVKNSA